MGVHGYHAALSVLPKIVFLSGCLCSVTVSAVLYKCFFADKWLSHMCTFSCASNTLHTGAILHSAHVEAVCSKAIPAVYNQKVAVPATRFAMTED